MAELQNKDTEAPKTLSSTLSGLIMKYRTVLGSLGVPLMGCISGAMNIEHGVEASARAGINQMIHTGISTLCIFKIHDCVARRCASASTFSQKVLPALIPAALSAGGCYLIHKFGIPNIRPPSAEPELSTLPTAVMLAIVIPAYHAAYFKHKMGDVLAEVESHQDSK